ncbi:MAG: cytochrome P450 [Pseudomonadota bacterium]
MSDLASIDWYYDDLPGPAFAEKLHQLRNKGPVVPVKAIGGAMPVYYIVGHQALAEAFRDGEQFPPGHAYQIISLPFIGETFMSMNEDRHRLWRPPMTPSFRRHAVDKMDQQRLAEIGYEILDTLHGQQTIDLVSNFTRLYAFRVICEQLGLPIEQEREYYQWSMDLMFGGRDAEKSKAADRKLTTIVEQVVEARRAKPAEDQISRWIHDTEVEGKALNLEQIVAHIRLFFTAGATTTSDAMSNLFHALLTHPRAWEQCVDQPAAQQGALQELLRWNPPVAAQPRFSRSDQAVVLAGVEIPANTSVLFGIAAANRDPLVFPDPDRFDIERNGQGLMTFGPGLRTCPGMHLAQKNLATALRIVAERFPGLRLSPASTECPQGILLRGVHRLQVSW